MKDACRHAHEIISMAYDGEQVTSEDLRNAKAHCTTCPDCAAFVSGLARVRQVPGPVASEALIDKAMVAVKREAETRAAQAAKAERDAAEAAASGRAATIPVRAARSWTTWGGWAAAAAAIVLAVGVITVNGVRYMNSPTGARTEQSAYAPEAQVDSGLPESTASGAASNATAATDAAKDTLMRGDTPSYVVYQSLVYVVDDASKPIPADTLRLGSLTSDLGSGTIAEHDVFAGATAGTIFVAEDDRSGFDATVVTRTLSGQTYALTSAAFTEYGVWPQLPLGMSTPTSDDGSPTFTRAGTDDRGVAVFVLPGTDETAGFAIAPDTAGDDPAAGNPNWTWWSPLK